MAANRAGLRTIAWGLLKGWLHRLLAEEVDAGRPKKKGGRPARFGAQRLRLRLASVRPGGALVRERLSAFATKSGALQSTQPLGDTPGGKKRLGRSSRAN